MDILYDQILKMAKQHSIQFELGVSVEIKDFLASSSEVESYQLVVQPDNKAEVLIWLRDPTEFKIREIFFSFFHFICYGHAGFYARKVTEEYVQYILFTATDTGLAICCELKFYLQAMQEYGDITVVADSKAMDQNLHTLTYAPSLSLNEANIIEQLLQEKGIIQYIFYHPVSEEKELPGSTAEQKVYVQHGMIISEEALYFFRLDWRNGRYVFETWEEIAPENFSNNEEALALQERLKTSMK